jgi:hypothetical protein
MTTKLVSANLGLRLTLEVDGKEIQKEWSGVCPRGFNHPSEMIQAVCNILNDEFGTNYHIQNHLRYPKKEIKFARPAKIKSPKKISQSEFNRKIKELVP